MLVRKIGAAVKDGKPRSYNLTESSFAAICRGVPGVTDTTLDVDGIAFLELVEVSAFSAFPGRNVVPGGFDDDAAILAAEGSVGCQGEAGYLSVAHAEDFDVADVATEFDAVEMFLFHDELVFSGLKKCCHLIGEAVIAVRRDDEMVDECDVHQLAGCTDALGLVNV